MAAALDRPSLTLDALLGGAAELRVTIHPPALARDAVYGPLVRRASELAAAYGGPTNLGTTALAVLQRTDEVVVAERNRGKDAIIVLRGVPADIDPLQVVDAGGHAIWKVVQGDTRSGSRELSPVQPSDAALFVTSGLVWIVASGEAIRLVRAAVVGEPSGAAARAIVGDETALLAMTLPGDALPQLRQGALAPVGAGLRRVQLELTPGSRGLILGTLTYGDPGSAASAEGVVLAVTLAFRHRLEEDVQAMADGGAKTPAKKGGERLGRPGGNLEWLGAAKVEREGSVVVLRAPIPRPWLELLAHPDLPAPSAGPGGPPP